MNRVLSCCPVILRETTTLYQDVPVAGSHQMIPFEREVLWIRQSEAVFMFRHRGVDIKHLMTRNDWCGYLTSVNAIHDVDRLCNIFKIEHGDLLSLDIDLRIVDSPMFPDLFSNTVKWQEGADRKWYLEPELRDWFYTSNERLEVESHGDAPIYPRLMPSEVVSVKSFYSTRNHPFDEFPAELGRQIATWRNDAAVLATINRE